MSKWFEVQIVATTTVMVEMEDHETTEAAKSVAHEKYVPHPFTADEVDCVEVKDKFLETYIRSADDCFYL